MEKMKICTKCGRAFPASKEFFGIYHTSKDEIRLRAICKECETTQAREWRTKNRERVRENQRLFRQKEYKLRGKAPNQYSKDEIQILMKKEGITQWQVAVAMGMSSGNLSRKIREGSLSESEKSKIKRIIEIWKEVEE